MNRLKTTNVIAPKLSDNRLNILFIRSQYTSLHNHAKRCSDVMATDDPIEDTYQEIGHMPSSCAPAVLPTTTVAAAATPLVDVTKPHQDVRKLASQLHKQLSMGSPVLQRKIPPVLPKRGGSLRLEKKRDLPELPTPPKPAAAASSDAKPITVVRPLTFTHQGSLDSHLDRGSAEYESSEDLRSTKTSKKGSGGGYKSIRDVPKSVKKMNKVEVADCLRLVHLDEYRELFLQKDVDGVLLMDLDIDILMSEFGMSKFEALKLHKFVKEGWRPT